MWRNEKVSPPTSFDSIQMSDLTLLDSGEGRGSTVVKRGALSRIQMRFWRGQMMSRRRAVFHIQMSAADPGQWHLLMYRFLWYIWGWASGAWTRVAGRHAIELVGTEEWLK
jgi:hypothetical protein